MSAPVDKQKHNSETEQVTPVASEDRQEFFIV
jgi:hypothetical protein